jgi:hypothetical protein
MLSPPCDVGTERDLQMTQHAMAFVRDYVLSSERALADFNKALWSRRATSAQFDVARVVDDARGCAPTRLSFGPRRPASSCTPGIIHVP